MSDQISSVSISSNVLKCYIWGIEDKGDNYYSVNYSVEQGINKTVITTTTETVIEKVAGKEVKKEVEKPVSNNVYSVIKSAYSVVIYHIALDDNEHSIIIKSLNDERNSLIEEGKMTDAVDDLIVKVGNAPYRRIKVIERDNLIRQRFNITSGWNDKRISAIHFYRPTKEVKSFFYPNLREMILKL